jgi:PhnB protein
MVKINPYLMVSNGKSAIELYKDLFGAKQVDHMPFQKEAGAYFGFPEDFDYENSTMHAELDIGGATIMLSDNPMNKNRSGNVQILVNLDSKKDLDKIYEKVKEKGFEILMDLQKPSWGSWFLVFEDSYGIGWQLNFPEAE